jgi:hypothetical protein
VSRFEVIQDFNKHGGKAVDRVDGLTSPGNGEGRYGVEGAVYEGVTIKED